MILNEKNLLSSDIIILLLFFEKCIWKFRSDIVKKAELLTPVESFEALKVAVQNGADAVYLGGKKFGARQYADNFGEDELRKATKGKIKRLS